MFSPQFEILIYFSHSEVFEGFSFLDVFSCGGLTLAGCEMPAQPLLLLFNRRRGESKMDKLVG